jgi:CBS domain-containing protein
MVRVKDVMIKNVIKVKENDTVKDVLLKMAEYRVGGLPIVNEKNELKGFVSDGDIMRFVGKNDPVVIHHFYYSGIFYDQENPEEKVHRLLEQNIKAISQKRVVLVNEDFELERVARILGDKRVKKVPVVRGNTLVGIISRGDIIRSLAESIQHTSF